MATPTTHAATRESGRMNGPRMRLRSKYGIRIIR